MSGTVLLGFGVEGQAAARHFLAHGTGPVIAVDQRARTGPPPPAFADQDRFLWVDEEHANLEGADHVLRSPGIRPTHPLVKAALGAGKTVTTPTGYWLAHHAPPGTTTITGTKGKSSTVALLTALLGALGLKTQALGNIGAPPLDAKMPTASHPVAELSSYMMHDLPMGPYTHGVTSLYREHVTWHGTEAAYRAAKLRPFRQDPPARGLAPAALIAEERLPAAVRAFETQVPIADGRLMLGDAALDPVALHPRFAHGGERLALRAACAFALDHAAPDAIHQALCDLLPTTTGLPHRQETIPSTDGRQWVDDALATVPEATALSVDRWGTTPVTLLLGGVDRGQDFTGLAQHLARMAQITPIVFGPTGPRTAAALHQAGVLFQQTDGFTDALALAPRITKKGGVILFSPAAASEPPHPDYKARAALFRAAAESET